ncbi:hypothetical protein JCM24511_02195 [Saitozyma sp. JCM 24511]|nr:hypothetical protein JCM24511_02195 [Saitozyma sp. JCM 24511]
MPGPKYSFDVNGPSNWWSENYHYAQSVTLPVGPIVKCAGQGGWDGNRFIDTTNPAKQVRCAMENVDRVVREAGLRGWEDVFLVRSYHTDPMESLPALLEEINRRIPEHRPIWTAIGVKTLAGPEMVIEIEVEAARHDGQGD